MQADVAAEELVSTLRPALTTVDSLRDALEALQKTWSADQLSKLLESKCHDARKIAALALGCIGDAACVQPLAVALHDADPMVSRLAEHSLWSLWFRLGKPTALALVKCGNTHLHHGNFACAIERYTQAIQEDPTFAEAFNQRAIAHYLSEDYHRSIADCRQALALMPQHFGAMAGMGHCYAHLQRYAEARHCYRLALAMHPRLDGIAASLEQIEKLLHESSHPA